MARNGGSNKGSLSHRPSEMTISGHLQPSPEESSENTPLLYSSSSSSSNATDAKGKEQEEDPTAIFVKIIEEHLPWYKRPNVLWMLPIFGLTSVSSGMLISSLGQYQASLLCREYLSRHSSSSSASLAMTVAEGFVQTFTRPAVECQVPEIQAFTAKTLAMVEVIGGIASTFSIGYYSSLSDKHGRLNIMILQFVNTLLMLTAVFLMGVYWDQFGLLLMIFSSLLTGLLGGANMGQTMCLAYAADCTDPVKRSRIYSYLHAGLFLGLAVGPALGGALYTYTGTILSIVFLDMGITLVSLLLTVFVIPESLPSKQPMAIQRLFAKMSKKNDTSAVSAAATAVGVAAAERTAWHSHVTRSLAFFRPNGRNTNLILLAVISFLQNLAVRGTLSVIILYTNQIFHWGELEDGFLFTIGNVVRLVTLLGILPVLVHYYKKASVKKQQRKAAAAAAAALDQENNGTFMGHGNTANMNGQFMFNPNVTSSVQSLGEAAFDFEDDVNGSSSIPSSFEEEHGSHMDGRHRHPSVDSVQTLSTKASSPSLSPHTIYKSTGTTLAGKRPKADRSVSTASTVRTKEQTFSDMKFDTWMIRLGFAINSITYLGYGLATVGWVFYLAVALHAISIVSSPSLKTLLTNLVEPSQFGAVLGAIQVVDSIAAVCSPIVISWVYALTVGTMPEFVWYSCAGFTGICVVLSFMIRQKQFRINME